MNHSNMLLKRIIIFITLTVFTVTSHCTVLAYDGTTGAEVTAAPIASHMAGDAAAPAASDTADRTYSDEGYEHLDPEDPAVQELIKDVEPLEAPEATAFPTTSGIKIFWTEVEDADGYKVFRQEAGTAEWKEIKDTDAATVRVVDQDLTNGKEYTYAVCAYQHVEVTLPAEETEEALPDEKTEEALPDESVTPPADTDAVTPSETTPDVAEDIPEEETLPEPETFYVTIEGERVQTNSIFRLSPSSVTSLSKSGTTLTAAWKTNKKVTGYQVEYANNRFFEEASSITLTGAYATSVTLTGLSASAEYYVRVRGYTLQNGETIYAPWALSSNAKGTKTATASVMKHKPKKKSIAFELRSQAGGKVGKCDTLQGGCTDGTYGYFILYNRNTQKCRIIKVDLSTLKVVKKSKALKIYHGNDMTYNPDTKELIAIYGQPYCKKLVVIDPTTLKITKKKELELPEQLPGMPEDQRAAFKGIGAIAYNTEHHQYVARIHGNGNLLFFDQDFTPLRYIYLSKKGGQTYQGMDTARDYILVGQSYASGKPYNIITVYDWNGTFLSTVNVRKGYELENVFHTGDTFYAGFYTSGYEYVTVTKYKTKRVRGKKKKVKVKVKQQRLYRNNYLYKVTKL